MFPTVHYITTESFKMFLKNVPFFVREQCLFCRHFDHCTPADDSVAMDH